MDRLHVSICVGLCLGFFSVSAKPLSLHELGKLSYYMSSDPWVDGLARLKECYSEYGDYDSSSDQSEPARLMLVRGVLAQASYEIGIMLQADTASGSAVDIKAIIQVLNRAYYCSKMLESVEQKFEQMEWVHEDDLLADDTWLYEVIEAIRVYDYNAVQVLTAGRKPTRAQVRMLLDECVSMQEHIAHVQKEADRYLSALRRFVKPWAATVGALWVSSLVCVCVAPMPYDRLWKVLQFFGTVIGVGGVWWLPKYNCPDGTPPVVRLHTIRTVRLASNAISQLIVERFLNGVPF